MSDWARIDPVALDRWLTTPPDEDEDDAPHPDGCKCEECRPDLCADMGKPDCDKCGGLGVVDTAPDQPRLDSIRKCAACNGTGKAQGSVYAANADLYRQE